ncbi:hypothetical protein [Pseudomonas syringae]|uniref:Uncharacterized protein n=1 Tax=Pseudomonas syringae pv. actinidiae TaxID=103796 RepID=A0A7Z6U884_PSESF|nr:hypothetical protein [Pseudomonas syringae]RMP81127.1 hypothetical protein ALQ15_02297 [Pseudomonas syringae pv. actinidiae]
MNWSPVNIRWPEQSTQWMDGLTEAQDMATAALGKTAERVQGLTGLVSIDINSLGVLAQTTVDKARDALNAQFSEIPRCIAITPFQSGVGQGKGNQRFLSAPNLLQRLADKLEDGSDSNLPTGEQYALVILFLGTRYDGLADSLAKFNAVLPIADLQKAERRAGNLFTLESEKWTLPSAGMLPRWADLPLERCTVVQDAKQAISSQVARLESYAADSSPLSDLAELAQRKAEQALSQSDSLNDLKDLLANGTPDATMQARLLGPGDTGELRKQLLAGEDTPGHEWVLSSGVMLVGSLQGLAFVRELVGL